MSLLDLRAAVERDLPQAQALVDARVEAILRTRHMVLAR